MKAIIILALVSMSVLMAKAQEGHHHHIFDYYSHPYYEYHYGVHDPHHHDVHDQWEKRDGDKVHGQYSLKQPDGRKRIVEYEADKHGVNYKVKFEGHAIHEVGHHGGGGGGGGGGGDGGGHHDHHLGGSHHGESFIEGNLHTGHHELVRVVENHHHH